MRPSWRLLCWICCSMMAVGTASAQEEDLVPLQLWLRAHDGSTIVGQTVVLQRLPGAVDVTPLCRTDANGMCAWQVRRGLYQVIFSRTLDGVSELAVAEGGLQGLGITVSDVPIAYHFTFHIDGRVYFDATPEAAVPSPVIPAADDLHSGILSAAVPSPVAGEGTEVTSMPLPTATPELARPVLLRPSWRVLFLLGLGLFIGGGFHILRRRSARAGMREREQRESSLRQEVNDA